MVCDAALQEKDRAEDDEMKHERGDKIERKKSEQHQRNKSDERKSDEEQKLRKAVQGSNLKLLFLLCKRKAAMHLNNLTVGRVPPTSPSFSSSLSVTPQDFIQLQRTKILSPHTSTLEMKPNTTKIHH